MSLFDKVGLPSGRQPVATREGWFSQVWYSWLMKMAKSAIAKGDYGIGTVATSNVTSTADITSLGTTYVAMGGGGFTVTIASGLVGRGNRITFKNVGTSANTLTIATEGSEQIENGNTTTVSGSYFYATYESDGTDWWRIA